MERGGGRVGGGGGQNPRKSDYLNTWMVPKKGTKKPNFMISTFPDDILCFSDNYSLI